MTKEREGKKGSGVRKGDRQAEIYARSVPNGKLTPGTEGGDIWEHTALKRR